MQWFTFKAGDKVFGLDATHIYRVVDDARVTPVPFVPPSYMGLTYYRGETFDVIDLSVLLGEVRQSEVSEHPVLILVKWSGKKWALAPSTTIGLVWMENEIDQDTVYSSNTGEAVNFLKPETIWERLQELPYGPDKI